jgi:formate dehydrogenase major subunit
LKNLQLTLDDELIEAACETTILEAARSRGIFIPTFCHLKDATPESCCRICVVEVQGAEDLAPACSTLVRQDMVIRTSTPRVALARRTCLELLLSDHLGDCLGPCMAACPAGIDIPGFIDHLARGEDREALRLILRDMPLPASLGRICKRPCEDACRRQLLDEEPVAICHLKRFAADAAPLSPEVLARAAAPSSGKRIAIVGAGPAGLSAAFHLALCGHRCTVFDAHHEPGGMLRYGIPGHRLPREVIERDVKSLKALGIELRLGQRLGTDIHLDELRRQHDAVFLALGAERSCALGVPGEDARGCLLALAFLRDHAEAPEKRDLFGQKVIVIGGGDVAVDAARVARRRGAASVRLYCLEEDDAQMPACAAEIAAARDEGIEICPQHGVKRILTKGGGVTGVELMRCTSVFDASGRFAPRYDESETKSDDGTSVIVAIGQGVDTAGASGVATTSTGNLACNATTQATNVDRVFTGGDCTTGPLSAVEAIAAGRRAAVAIDGLVMGRTSAAGLLSTGTHTHSMGSLDEVPKVVLEHFAKRERTPMPSLAPSARAETSAEVETGYTAEMAQSEAQRCMLCGCRGAHKCRLREYAAAYGADAERLVGRRREYSREELEHDIIYDSHKCILCQNCARITLALCGQAAMEVVGRGFESRMRPVKGREPSRLTAAVLRQMVEQCPVGALTRKDEPVQTRESQVVRPRAKC